MSVRETAAKRVQEELQKFQHKLASNDERPPELDAVLLLALASAKNGHELQEQLSKRLLGLLSKKWIETEDLNKVFWVLYSLHKFESRLIDGEYLAYAINRLTKSELKVGGPYGTKNSIDPITNGLIAALLIQYGVSLPNIEKYITKIIASFDTNDTKEISAETLCFIYAASPILKGQDRQKILTLLNKLQPKDLKNSLYTAVYISSVLKLEPKTKINTYIEHLLSQIDDKEKTGSAFYFSAKNTTVETILRSVLIVEALSFYVSIQNEKTKSTTHSSLYKTVCSQTKSEFANLPSPLDKTSLKMWRKMIEADKNREIILMPKFFAETLIECPDYLMSECGRLGSANFYNWIATVIYDDFIDEEGSPELLPAANVAHRLSLQIYREVLTNMPYFNAYVEKLYQEVDQANAWEVANTRAAVSGRNITITNLPKYKGLELLAQRALGHVIGPILITIQLPCIQSGQIKEIEQAMKHYLIARQLNDDLHDWRKDLQAGHLSSILADMLGGIGVKPGIYSLDTLIPELENFFLKQGLKITCEKLLEHVTSSRNALKASTVTKNYGGFISLLDGLQLSAEDALSIALSRQNFLKAYNET